MAAEIKEQSLPVVEQATGEEQSSQDEESDNDEYFPEEDGDSVYDEDSSNQEEDSEAGSGSSPEPSTSRVQAATSNNQTQVTVPRPLRPYTKATPKFPYQPSAEWDEVFAEFPREFIEHVYRQKMGKFYFKLWKIYKKGVFFYYHIEFLLFKYFHQLNKLKKIDLKIQN